MNSYRSYFGRVNEFMRGGVRVSLAHAVFLDDSDFAVRGRNVEILFGDDVCGSHLVSVVTLR